MTPRPSSSDTYKTGPLVLIAKRGFSKAGVPLMTAPLMHRAQRSSQPTIGGKQVEVGIQEEALDLEFRRLHLAASDSRVGAGKPPAPSLPLPAAPRSRPGHGSVREVPCRLTRRRGPEPARMVLDVIGGGHGIQKFAM